MRVQVFFFGPAKDVAGQADVVVDLPAGTTVGDLKRALLDRHPRIEPVLKASRLAVNRSFAGDEVELHAGDEAAVIPPVSGGCGRAGAWVELFREPWPPSRVREFLGNDPRWGGRCFFEGVTREERDPVHGALTCLDYEAYEVMAERELRRLASEAQARWSLGPVVLLHRLGRVTPGEVSVAIAAAAAHRAASFEACRWLIETLKTDVPIWKKNVFADGFTRWVEGIRPFPERNAAAALLE